MNYVAILVAALLGALLPNLLRRIPTGLLLAMAGGFAVWRDVPYATQGTLLLAGFLLIVATVGLIAVRLLGMTPEEGPVPSDATGQIGALVLVVSLFVPAFVHPQFGVVASIHFLDNTLAAVLVGAALLWVPATLWFAPLAALAGCVAVLVAGAVVLEIRNGPHAAEITVAVAAPVAALGGVLLILSALLRSWGSPARTIAAVALCTLPLMALGGWYRHSTAGHRALVAAAGSADLGEALHAAMQLPPGDEARQATLTRMLGAGPAGAEAVAVALRDETPGARLACLTMILPDPPVMTVAALTPALEGDDTVAAGQAMSVLTHGHRTPDKPPSIRALRQVLRSEQWRLALAWLAGQPWDRFEQQARSLLLGGLYRDEASKELTRILVTGARAASVPLRPLLGQLHDSERRTLFLMLAAPEDGRPLEDGIADDALRAYLETDYALYPQICDVLISDCTDAQRLAIVSAAAERMHGERGEVESTLFVRMVPGVPPATAVALWQHSADHEPGLASAIAVAVACHRDGPRNPLFAGLPLARYLGDPDVEIRRQLLCAMREYGDPTSNSLAAVPVTGDGPSELLLRRWLGGTLPADFDPTLLTVVAKLRNALDGHVRDAADRTFMTLRDKPNEMDLAFAVARSLGSFPNAVRETILRTATGPRYAQKVQQQAVIEALLTGDPVLQAIAVDLAGHLTLEYTVKDLVQKTQAQLTRH